MFIIGNMNQHLRSMKMEQRWKLKKSGVISLTAKAGLNVSLTEVMSPKKTGLSKEEICKKLAKIRRKLASGARLTASEKEFLRQYAPELYRKAIALEEERAAYERRLKACKTREEAEQVKLEKMAEIAAAQDKEDAEFAMARLSQMEAAEKDLDTEIRKKPRKQDLDEKKRAGREKEKEKQVKRERERWEEQKELERQRAMGDCERKLEEKRLEKIRDNSSQELQQAEQDIQEERTEKEAEAAVFPREVQEKASGADTPTEINAGEQKIEAEVQARAASMIGLSPLSVSDSMPVSRALGEAAYAACRAEAYRTVSQTSPDTQEIEKKQHRRRA